MILDGKKIRDDIRERLKSLIKDRGIKPMLTILQIGKRQDSTAYILQKKIFAEKIGAAVEHIVYEEDVDEARIHADIEARNANPAIHGIILQIPIPAHFNVTKLIECIDPRKDVDGLTSTNLKKLFEHDTSGMIPATTKGILTLLDAYKIPSAGKKVVVVGRSSLVGKPTALALLNRDATVTICHHLTEKLSEETRHADILIVATGHAGLITKEYVNSNQVIIDVGITATTISGEKKIVGDVCFDEIKDIVAAITPVPGGVGPLTVASLFENLLKSCTQFSASA